MKEPLFPAGRLLVSDDVMASLPDYMRYIRRHLSGDWGGICEQHAWENQKSVSNGDEILSQYSVRLSNGALRELCIMSEKHRTYTVVFLISESTSA